MGSALVVPQFDDSFRMVDGSRKKDKTPILRPGEGRGVRYGAFALHFESYEIAASRISQHFMKDTLVEVFSHVDWKSFLIFGMVSRAWYGYVKTTEWPGLPVEQLTAHFIDKMGHQEYDYFFLPPKISVDSVLYGPYLVGTTIENWAIVMASRNRGSDTLLPNEHLPIVISRKPLAVWELEFGCKRHRPWVKCIHLMPLEELEIRYLLALLKPSAFTPWVQGPHDLPIAPKQALSRNLDIWSARPKNSLKRDVEQHAIKF